MRVFYVKGEGGETIVNVNLNFLDGIDEILAYIYPFSSDLESRDAYLQSILAQEFNLIYYGRFSLLDVEGTAVPERIWFHAKLVKQKEDEAEAQKKAIEEAKNKNKSN